jgi:type IV pilus assembly protein PilQ
MKTNLRDYAMSGISGLSFVARVTLFAVAVSAQALAAEVQSLAWEGQGDAAALRIKIAGDAAASTEVLDGGQRLRIVLGGATMGAAVNELGGQGRVKGVYPYLAESGQAVHVDLLLSEPGVLALAPSQDGYRAVVKTDVAATTAATATAVATPSAAAAPAPKKVVLQDIIYSKLAGDRIQITLKMSGPVPEPRTFSITNPARVSLDFSDVRVGMDKKTVTIKQGAVTSVTAVEAEGRSRVVLSLIKSVPYTTGTSGNNFIITVDTPTSAIAAAEQPKTTHFATTQKTGKFSLKNIDFRRGAQGDGKIIITLSDPAVGIDVREQAGEIMLDFLNTSVPAELQRRLDVVDFATPVQTIDTSVRGKNTRMVIVPRGKYEHVAYQAGNVFTVSIKPIIETPDAKKVDEFGYSGEKLSLNFQNIDVRAALQVLADFTGLNFVVSDTVKGSLTLRLKDVPWDQALDIIVDAKNLAVRKKGNVVAVAPAAEVAAKEKAALEATKSVLELEPLTSELIQINYAKASEIATLLKSIKPVGTLVSAQEHPVFGAQATGRPDAQASASNSLLSPRGQVTVDTRSNSILVQDTAAKIREIRKLIAQLDQPVRQVMIETRLVEARSDFARTLGVRLGGYGQNTTSNGTGVVRTGRMEVLDQFYNSNTFEILPGGLNVNLPSGGIGDFSPAGITLSFLTGSNMLNLELTALEQEGTGKIIASPRLITANQQKATIEQGQERVFTTSVLGVGQVITKKATLKLDVTPRITPDDRVSMDVDITKDDFADATAGLLNVKQIKTQVLLDNGETVAIGGIYTQDKLDTITKVPFLGDLPLLGWLFKNKANQDTKTELLIFLTPRILSEKIAVR